LWIVWYGLEENALPQITSESEFLDPQGFLLLLRSTQFWLVTINSYFLLIFLALGAKPREFVDFDKSAAEVNQY